MSWSQFEYRVNEIKNKENSKTIVIREDGKLIEQPSYLYLNKIDLEAPKISTTGDLILYFKRKNKSWDSAVKPENDSKFIEASCLIIKVFDKTGKVKKGIWEKDAINKGEAEILYEFNMEKVANGKESYYTYELLKYRNGAINSEKDIKLANELDSILKKKDDLDAIAKLSNEQCLLNEQYKNRLDCDDCLKKINAYRKHFEPLLNWYDKNKTSLGFYSSLHKSILKENENIHTWGHLTDSLKKLEASKNKLENEINSLKLWIDFTKGASLSGVDSDGDGFSGLSKEFVDKSNALKAKQKELDKVCSRLSKLIEIIRSRWTLYSGLLYQSESIGNPVFMRNHDAENKMKLLGNTRVEYYDYESIVHLIHNSKNTIKPELIQTFVPITDHKSSLVQQTDGIFDELLGLKGLKPNLGQFKKLDSIHTDASFQTKGTGPEGFEHCDELEQLKINLKKLSGFSESANILQQLKLTSLQDKSINTSIFIEPEPKKIKKPATISYTISEGKESVRKSYSFENAYVHYKTSPVQVQIGLNVYAGEVMRQSAKEDNGKIIKEIEDERINIMAMVKYYPAGVQIDDNNMLAGLTGFRNFSFIGGVGLTNPLNDLYVGVGIDLIPGINLNIGYGGYRTKQYSIENGKITDTRSIYKGKLNGGLALDAQAFKKLITFIF